MPPWRRKLQQTGVGCTILRWRKLPELKECSSKLKPDPLMHRLRVETAALGGSLSWPSEIFRLPFRAGYRAQKTNLENYGSRIVSRHCAPTAAAERREFPLFEERRCKANCFFATALKILAMRRC